MVRIMVGTLLGLQAGSLEAGSIPAILESGSRERAARPLQPAAYIWIMSFIPMKNNAQADFIRL